MKSSPLSWLRCWTLPSGRGSILWRFPWTIRRYEDKYIRFGDIGVEILSGEGACPQEDCGGVSGYEEILRIIKDPEDPHYDWYRSQFDENFDPAHFDILSVRRRLYDYERTISEVLHGFYERW